MHTDFLFARPSFVEGVARILDVGATLNAYNISETGPQADVAALAADVRAVAGDIRAVVVRLRRCKRRNRVRLNQGAALNVQGTIQR